MKLNIFNACLFELVFTSEKVNLKLTMEYSNIT